jgi:tetratricopeptide (TPR) repeat protein
VADLGGAIGIAEEIDDRALRVQGHLRMGMLLYNTGDLANAESEFERCSALASDLGSSRIEALATYPLGVIKYLRGDVSEAERLGEQARSWLARTGDTYFQIQNLLALAQLGLARDDAVGAEAHLREALPLALAERSWFAAEIYRCLTDALLRQDRLGDAGELVEFARRDAQEGQPYVQAAVRLAAAYLATAKRDRTAALASYDEAISLLEQMGLHIDLAQARISYGRALRKLGEPDRARNQLDLAHEACTAVGAIGLVEELEKELALVGSRAG